MFKIAVFISGNGSNLQELIENSKVKNSDFEFEIVLVVSNRLGAYGLARAEKAGIPTITHLLKPYKDAGKSRTEYDLDLVAKIKETCKIDLDLIVLAGFMHILSAEFINAFPEHTIINLHPALPGCFDGAKAIERAYEAFQKKEISETGVMVHWCIPEVDRGQVIVQQVCAINQSDSLQDLQDRIHQIEHGLLVQGTELALALKRSK